LETVSGKKAEIRKDTTNIGSKRRIMLRQFCLVRWGCQAVRQRFETNLLFCMINDSILGEIHSVPAGHGYCGGGELSPWVGRRVGHVTAAALLGAGLVSCGHSDHPGRISGTLIAVGGPMGRSQPIDGYVLVKGTGTRRQVRVTNGVFTVTLRGGDYTLTAFRGRDPTVGSPCTQSIAVRVLPKQTRRVTLTCVQQ
jgi:hypothetical protein